MSLWVPIFDEIRAGLLRIILSDMDVHLSERTCSAAKNRNGIDYLFDKLPEVWIGVGLS